MHSFNSVPKNQIDLTIRTRGHIGSLDPEDGRGKGWGVGGEEGGGDL